MFKIFAVLLLAFFTPEVFAQCSHPQPDGSFIFTADTAADCTGYWFVTAAEYNAYLTAVEITLADVTSAFMWGFGVVLFFAALGFKINIATGLVRKI